MLKCIAGIVLYNPDLNLLKENVDNIYPQVEKLVFVDNNSKNIDEIKKLYDSDSKIHIISNCKNKGIATALNQIIYFCDEKEVEWALTLDQDSVCPLNIIQEFEKYISFERVAIICPKILDRKIGSIEEEKEIGVNDYEFVKGCITSASLTNVKICKKLGYFDDKMFIDFVDFDYCTTVIENDYKIIKVNTATLLHQVGDPKLLNFFGKKVIIYNHSPIRKYYFTRNMIYYINKHKDTINVSRAYMNLIKKLFITIIFEDQKLKKMKMIFKGIKNSKKIITEFKEKKW